MTIDPYHCLKCEKFKTHDIDELNAHVESCGVLQLKGKEKSTHEKLSEVLGSKNHITFWVTTEGVISYCFGEGMSAEQLVMVSKFLEIIANDTVVDTFQMNKKDGK
jgi:hypothetical protein